MRTFINVVAYTVLVVATLYVNYVANHDYNEDAEYASENAAHYYICDVCDEPHSDKDECFAY